MSVERIGNHPQRLALTNELHARPFAPMQAPGRCLHLALKQPRGAAERDPQSDRDHLVALLDRHGAAHPGPGASHHTTELGRVRLKCEQQTEFILYPLYADAPSDALFAPALMQHLPDDWLAAAPGKVIAAISSSSCKRRTPRPRRGCSDAGWSGSSIPRARQPPGCWTARPLVAGDFRVHGGGFSRFAFVLCGEAGPRRIGRVWHRLLEIEVYRTLAMLALPIARRTAARLSEIERKLGELVAGVAGRIGAPVRAAARSAAAQTRDLPSGVLRGSDRQFGAAVRCGGGARGRARTGTPEGKGV